MSKWHDSKSLKMKFVFLIAGEELYKWKSKHTRIAVKMMESYTEQRIIKLLGEEIERIRLMTDYPATNALANIRAVLIKGENK